ncbi:expressed unknown protein [Seminavis robusta]|uniref:Uncharacterized protein n=1 Tax=Seminavis robusta TaxID=568900 RepID=A0A9N8DP43_9STRA|nr:expressed unknown protein [Seminavis robusta]|eukprot:Sro270_g104260.1 n/a (217) ;mRNA; f:43901-44753
MLSPVFAIACTRARFGETAAVPHYCSLNLPFGNDDDDDSSSSSSSRSGDSASAHLEDEYNVSSNTRTIGRNLQSLVGNEDEEGEEEKEEELSFSDDAFEEFAARELAPEEVEESITCIMIDLDDDSDGDDDDEEDVGTCTDDASAACDIEMSVFQPDAVEDLDKEEEEEDDDESASFMIDAGSRSSHGLPNFSWHENAERRMASLERGNRRHSMTS